MNQKLNDAYQGELDLSRAASEEGRVAVAFHHLERAHILGQRDTWAHVRTHWLMLRLGASADQWREVAGQAIRIVAAALFSRIWVPVGNTGRANVSAVKPMPIPEDLRLLMSSGRVSWR